MEGRALKGIRVIAYVLILMGMYQLRFPIGFLFVIKVNNPICSSGYSTAVKKTNELGALLKEKSIGFNKDKIEILNGKLEEIRRDVEILKQKCRVVPNPMKLSILICLVSASLFVYTAVLIMRRKTRFWIFMILSIVISLVASLSYIWAAMLSVEPVYSLSCKFSFLASEIYETPKPALLSLQGIAKKFFLSPLVIKGLAFNLIHYVIFILAICIYFNRSSVKEQFK